MIGRVLLILRRLTLARSRTSDRHCRHRAMFAVDIAGFAGRPAHLQALLRKVLYGIVQDACDTAGLPWRQCIHEDRGDGMFVIAASDVDFKIVLNLLASHMGVALGAHNRAADSTARIQVRMAVHAGFFQPDDHGITSPDLNHLFRLLDAPALKESLATHPGDLALIVSDYLYEIATSYNLINPADYRPTTVNLKETNAQAWIRSPALQPPTPPAPQHLALLIPVTLVRTTAHAPGTSGPTAITCVSLTDLLRQAPINPSAPDGPIA